MNITYRRIGEHRGAPRLYLDCAALQRAGFCPGATYSLRSDSQALRLTLCLDPAGSRRVSRKRRGPTLLPVIDINSAGDLAPLGEFGVVRIIILAGAIHVLLSATACKALARSARLAARLALDQPLQTAGIAFGAGIASTALHEGLAAGGIRSRLVLANELCEDYLALAAQRNTVVLPDTALVAAPMQELVADDWLLRRLPKVDVLEAGIPCSGASRAGAAKRGLARMEDHPTVGHLIGATIELIAALQPAIVLIENVVPYRDSASAAILRGWLRDAGYAVHETVLDSSDFGSLEQRVRWFLVACPVQIGLDLSSLAQATVAPTARSSRSAPHLADFLEDIGPDDERFRQVEYLKEKATRDKDKGSHFAMQWLRPQSSHVPTLRKGYHKGGSTDPRLLHPTDPARSRLLTGVEHARIKGIDSALVAGISDSLAHQVCGQAVDTRPVMAIGRCLANALVSARQHLTSAGSQAHWGMSQTATGATA